MALPLSQAFTARSLGVMWDNYKASLALPPYLGRQKFGTTKQDSLEMRYILGENSQPISLKASSFDAQAELREELQYHTHIQPEDEETQIMQMIDQEKRIQRKQVQERLGISQTTSGRILKQMVKKGLIMQRGRGKNTCYVKK